MDRRLKDRAPSLNDLVKKMEAGGYRFMRFEIACEDPCLPVDVEWNYKDLVHVGHVHSHMSRQFFYIGENIYTTIDLQKFLGITLPQSGVFYVTDDNRIVVHTTLFFYVIFVEIRYELVGDLQTCTTTNYAVGTRSRLLGLLDPLIRFALRRNWARFTKDDRPLRQRRGALRKKGYSFIDRSPIDHRVTLDTSEPGVVLPSNPPEGRTNAFVVSDHVNTSVIVGDADHLGLQISFGPDEIKIFPRLCPHRGASLDSCSLSGNAIECPWHGRQFRPLARIAHNGTRQTFEGSFLWCDYDGGKLTIETRTDEKKGVETDWTLPWTAVQMGDDRATV